MVVDDASQQRLVCAARLGNGLPVRSVWLPERQGWAGLNAAVSAADARSKWLVFLRDTACPVSGEFASWLDDWDEGVVAVAPDVFADACGVQPARRVSSSLPESLPTTAFAVRRDAFVRAGGFSQGLSGPGAVLDLCARLVGGRGPGSRPGRAGRIVFDARWVVAERVGVHRTVSRASWLKQVRDYAFALAVYAPEDARGDVARFVDDFVCCRGGRARQLLATVLREVRTMPLGGGSAEVWDRLTGLAAVREALGREQTRGAFRTASLEQPGRHAWVIERALREQGVVLVDPRNRPDVHVVGTLARGAMFRAVFGRRASRHAPRLVVPWVPELPAGVAPRPAVAA